MRERWRHVLEAGDPYYSPNLSLHGWGFSIDPGRGFGSLSSRADTGRASSASVAGVEAS